MNKEFDFIKKYFTPLGTNSDDFKNDGCEIQIPLGKKLFVSNDTLISGSHFFSDTPPNLIAKRALRANLSDIASLGAQPFCYILGLSTPGSVCENWISEFSRGLAEDGKLFKIHLKGGDTTSNIFCAIFINITIFGLLPEDTPPLSRSGAKSEDKIYVSGEIGSSYVGFLLKSGQESRNNLENPEYFLKKFDLPEPKIELGCSLVGTATSCIDISDGLLQDLFHLCEESDLDAYIESSRIPTQKSALKIANLMKLIRGGEDFELLFSLPKNISPNVEFGAKEIGHFKTKISEIPQIFLDGRPLEISEIRSSHSHFKD